jgi:hypothetical protein
MRNTFSLEDFRSMETITGEDINYIEEGYLIFRFGELQRTGGLDFKTYRYYADQLNSQAGILRILLAKNLVYSNRDVQVYWLNTQ